jgi:hypothetical protein
MKCLETRHREPRPVGCGMIGYPRVLHRERLASEKVLMSWALDRAWRHGSHRPYGTDHVHQSSRHFMPGRRRYAMARPAICFLHTMRLGRDVGFAESGYHQGIPSAQHLRSNVDAHGHLLQTRGRRTTGLP